MIHKWRRGNEVKRFHTVKRLREETVGHHSANVCGILLALDKHCSRDLLVAALTHDLAEQHTGDVPAPAKWESDNLRNTLRHVEVNWLVEHVEPHLTGGTSLWEEAMLKLADMTDLVLSCIEEKRMGNAYAVPLINRGMEYIRDLQVNEEYKQKALQMIQEAEQHVSE